jgi:hypothetical protein
MRKIILLMALLLLRILPSQAQSSKDLRINEFLVLNDSGYVDDFGVHSPWIEIFNSAYNYVDIGGCYLTNDLQKPALYLIPKGDPITLIAPRNYIVFWADNKPTHGILHLNFNLENSKMIALFDSDGRTLIDSVTLTTPKPDISFGRVEDGGLIWGYHEKTTPNANNQTEPQELGAERIIKIDPYGLGMAVIAMSIVFLVLMMIFLMFKQFSISVARNEKRKALKISSPDDIVVTEEMAAAIGLALHLYQKDMADYENLVLTINKVSRTYSPWNSKLYGISKWPKAF